MWSGKVGEGGDASEVDWRGDGFLERTWLGDRTMQKARKECHVPFGKERAVTVLSVTFALAFTCSSATRKNEQHQALR